MQDPQGAAATTTVTPLRASAIDTALASGVAAAPDPAIVVMTTNDGVRIEWANRAFCDLLMADPADLNGQRLDGLMTLDWEWTLNPLRSTRSHARLTSQLGAVSSWSLRSCPISDGDLTRWTLFFSADDEDATDEVATDAHRYRALTERAPIGIFASEAGLRLGYVNDWLAELVGVPADQLLGVGWMSIFRSEDLEVVMGCMQQALDGVSSECPARFVTASGEQRSVSIRIVPHQSNSGPASFLGTVEDVTDRMRVEELLEWQASHDSLTGLKNRSGLIDAITTTLLECPTSTSVVFIDLDNFKFVNDLLGHAAGDDLLKTAANALTSAVRSGDEVFRFAGDEFVAILRNTNTDDEALRAAERIGLALGTGIESCATVTPVDGSVGVVRSTLESTAESLLGQADAAMYTAKRRGKGTVVLFDESMDASSGFTSQRHELDTDAIERGEVTRGYVPILPVASGASDRSPEPHALSCRVTWTDPDGQVHRDEELWEAARESGMVPTLLFANIGQACEDLSAFRRSGVDAPGGVVIALAVADLCVPGLADQIARSLVRCRLTGGDITLVLHKYDATVPSMVNTTIDQVRDLGVKVWARWESVSLQRFAVGAHRPDGVVIDVSELDAGNHAGYEALITMLRGSGTAVCAHRVDSADRLATVDRLGIEWGVGAALGSIDCLQAWPAPSKPALDAGSSAPSNPDEER